MDHKLHFYFEDPNILVEHLLINDNTEFQNSPSLTPSGTEHRAVVANNAASFT
jgi:hypothetical protein